MQFFFVFFVVKELLFLLFFKKAASDEIAETMLFGVKVWKDLNQALFFFKPVMHSGDILQINRQMDHYIIERTDQSGWLLDTCAWRPSLFCTVTEKKGHSTLNFPQTSDIVRTSCEAKLHNAWHASRMTNNIPCVSPVCNQLPFHRFTANKV